MSLCHNTADIQVDEPLCILSQCRYHSVAVGVVLFAIVLRIIKLLVPLKFTQEDALTVTYCTLISVILVCIV